MILIRRLVYNCCCCLSQIRRHIWWSRYLHLRLYLADEFQSPSRAEKCLRVPAADKGVYMPGAGKGLGKPGTGKGLGKPGTDKGLGMPAADKVPRVAQEIAPALCRRRRSAKGLQRHWRHYDWDRTKHATGAEQKLRWPATRRRAIPILEYPLLSEYKTISF